jgi:glycosyltransferase involved in cell wall biosynthesis
MKIAIVHERLDVVGGAERVIASLHRLYPDAPVYTSFVETSELTDEFRGMDIRPSYMQRLPRWVKRRSDRLLPFYLYAFQNFDLSAYDVVISSSYVAAKSVLTPADTCHICYCHTPMRYGWEKFPQYINTVRPGVFKILNQALLQYFRVWDFQTAQNVDYFISTSDAVAQRIRKHYRRESHKIHPPVETHRFRPNEKPEDFYLAISRLVPYKRIDLAVEAFQKLNRRLLVIGTGRQYDKLKSRGGRNVEFLGWQPDEKVADYMSRARALIFPGEEDFGIVPVEAQAAGTPVIAYGRGGVRETVRHGETGYFFAEQTADSLAEAVQQFECLSINRKAVAAHAKQFDEPRFHREMQEFVEQCHREFDSGRRPLPPLSRPLPVGVGR